MRRIKNFVRSLIGVKNDTDFYSQGGEDAVASNLFSQVLEIRNGFYVDVGAYHPFRHSNTYLLCKAGWRGMNIDPRPGTKELFDRYRPNDVNIEAGIASENGTMTYYIVGEDSTMNTFSKENLERLGLFDNVERTVEIPIRSLGSILADHLEVTHVDYLNIDAEGFERQIIAGLDACPIKPTVISIEQNGVLSLTDVIRSETSEVMAARGYTPVAKNIILRDVATVFYIRNEHIL